MHEARHHFGEGADFCEEGVRAAPGARTDIQATCPDVVSGKRMRDIAIDHSAVFVKHFRGLPALAGGHYTVTYNSTVCSCLSRATGSGKSRRARGSNGSTRISRSNSICLKSSGDRCLLECSGPFWTDTTAGCKPREALYNSWRRRSRSLPPSLRVCGIAPLGYMNKNRRGSAFFTCDGDVFLDKVLAKTTHTSRHTRHRW